MVKNKIEILVYDRIRKNIANLGRTIDDVSPETDLLKSGIIDSMEFVELLSEIGNETGISIENFLDDDELKITVNWFIKKFDKKD